MDKLTLDDVKVLGEGAQIKKLIEAKYGTLKKFHQQEDLSMCIKTLMNYCCSKKVRSEILKCLIINKFDKGWNEIVLTETEQITRHVYEIYNNIVLYRAESDIQLFNELIDLCSKYKLVNEGILMYRNIAKNYYYRNNNIKTIEYYNKAITLIGNQNIDTLVSLTVELADHYFMEQYIDECEKLFNKAQLLIENNQVSNAALYKYYFRMGGVKNIEGNYAKAREYYEKSVQYADINTESMSEKGAAFLSIGVTHKREGDYEEAKENYFHALIHFHEKDIYGRISAFNNLASAYCAMGDYDKAIKFIEQAKGLLDNEKITNIYLMISHTYVKIKLMLGDTSACYSFFDMLKATINSSIDKNDIEDNINSLITTLEDVELLKELNKTIYYIKENTDNNIYKKGLYSCIGRIHEKLTLKGGAL